MSFNMAGPSVRILVTPTAVIFLSVSPGGVVLSVEGLINWIIESDEIVDGI